MCYPMTGVGGNGGAAWAAIRRSRGGRHLAQVVVNVLLAFGLELRYLLPPSRRYPGAAERSAIIEI
jgi:hypothetical protein